MRKQLEGLLQLHAEKKALAVLLENNESELNVYMVLETCLDCHEFFKSASLWLGRSIQLHQCSINHTFTNGCCSCEKRWCWKARLTPAGTEEAEAATVGGKPEKKKRRFD